MLVDRQRRQKDVPSILRDQVVNFEKVHKAIKVGERFSLPILRKDRDSFLDFINSPKWYTEHLGALYQRALLYGHEPSAPGRAKMPLDSFMATLTKVLCYMGLHSEFLKSILSEGRLPKPADSGVLELMIYLADDSHLPERNPLRNNTLFFSVRKPLLDMDLSSSSPFRLAAFRKQPVSNSALSG